MWYHKFKYKGNLIEFKNGAWDGVEHIIVNGETLSSKFSIMGTSHEFMVGDERCTLIVKVNPLTMIDVYLSFYADRELIFKKVHIKATFSMPGFSMKLYSYKKQGEKHLKHYDIEEAIEQFTLALKEDRDDADSHFNLACCYSLQENVESGMYHLNRFIELKKHGLDIVKLEDKLAFLRVQPEFSLLQERG